MRLDLQSSTGSASKSLPPRGSCISLTQVPTTKLCGSKARTFILFTLKCNFYVDVYRFINKGDLEFTDVFFEFLFIYLFFRFC